MPKPRGVPKVVCLRGCVPKEQQGEKMMKTCKTVVFLQNPYLNVRVKIRNFHHFCGSAKALPCSGRFSAFVRKTCDTPVGQYGDPWSEVPRGNIKRTKVARFSKCIKAKK